MLHFLITRLFGKSCGKLRSYTTISPDGRLIVVCYRRLAEFVNSGAVCSKSQENVCSPQ